MVPARKPPRNPEEDVSSSNGSDESVESVVSDGDVDTTGDVESSDVSDMEAGQATPRAIQEVDLDGNPPMNDLGYDDVKLKWYLGIRLFQTLLAMTSFIALAESPAFGEMKKNATTGFQTSQTVDNKTTIQNVKNSGICGSDDTGIASCYNMITASNYLMATGVLYWMYLLLLMLAQVAMFFNKVIVENKRFLQVQIGTDFLWLFFSTTSNAAVGGSSGDDNWRLSVCMMLYITWTQVGSLLLGLKIWYTRKLIDAGILKEADLRELEAPAKKETPKKAHKKKKKKTIKEEQKKRGIDAKKSKSAKKPKSAKKKKKKKQPAPWSEEGPAEVSLTTLVATHSFPGKNTSDFVAGRDLAFKRSDVLFGIEMKHNGAWWFGRDKDGNEGEFPSNRVAEVPNAPETS